MITTAEIIKDMALWWMSISGIILLIIACFTIGPWLDKKFPEDKIAKKVLGKRLYKFLKEVL